MDIAFIAGFGPIVRDASASKAFYADALGLQFESEQGDYVFTENLGGVKHFGLLPLVQAAWACFGTTDWPTDIPIPQAVLEFELNEVEAVASAATELEERGYRLIHRARTEPWNQTVARLLTPEGLLVGVCYTPWHHSA